MPFENSKMGTTEILKVGGNRVYLKLYDYFRRKGAPREIEARISCDLKLKHRFADSEMAKRAVLRAAISTFEQAVEELKSELCDLLVADARAAAAAAPDEEPKTDN